MRKVSRTVKKGSNTSSCGTTPSMRRAARKSERVSRPQIRTLPPSARVKPARMWFKVVLPAPFGPSSPKNSPSSMVRLMYSALAILDNVFERRQFLLRAWRHVKNLKGSVFPICDQRINTICARQIRQLSRYIEKAKRHAARARGSAPGEQNSERRRIKMRQRRAIDPIRACCDVHQTQLKRCAGIRLC